MKGSKKKNQDNFAAKAILYQNLQASNF